MKFILIRGKSRHFLAVTRQQSRLFVPPATKLGQGNVFTGVCDSVNRGCLLPGGCLLRGCLVRWGWCLLPRGGACSGGWCLFRGCLLSGGGVCSQGVSALGGGVCSGGCLLSGGWCLLPGVSAPGGGAWWRPPRDGHCCGRYASYWNAFLLHFTFKVQRQTSREIMMLQNVFQFLSFAKYIELH